MRDEKVLRSIYKDYYPKVLGYILKNGGSEDDARDIFQEALIVIYKLIEKDELDIKVDFASFLIGVAKRIFLNQIRSKGVHERFLQKETFDFYEDHPSDQQLENEHELNLIRKHIVKLGDECRNILLWSAEGLSNTEIAEKSGFKNEHSLRNKKAKCKKALLEMIKKDPNYRSD